MDIKIIAKEIVDSAIHVHRTLGPGWFESTYQKCLTFELHKRGLPVDCEVILPIIYDGNVIESGYRLDLLVDHSVVIENKTVDALLPIHATHPLTYLRLGGYYLGFLINWKVELMKTGIKRIVNPAFKPTRRKEV